MPKPLAYLLAAISTASGALALLVASNNAARGQIELLEPYQGPLFAGAVGVALVSTLFWLAAAYQFLGLSSRSVRAAYETAVRRLWHEPFYFDPQLAFLTADDVDRQWDEIQTLVARSTSDSTPEEICLAREKMSMHARVNPTAVGAVYKLSPRGPDKQLVALAVISALRATAVEGIRQGTIRSGHELSEGHLCRDFRNASGAYIAGIYAVSRPAKAAIVLYVKMQLTTISGYRSVRYLFGRASTAAGRRLLTTNQFQPVKGNPAMRELAAAQRT
ncbi:MAG TPA: hypothetical protein VEQ85_10115 [Lacipirellulaceae bacterium]|nr:hypothetical protein [Lacipirellulaceae bacterium]